MINHYTVNIWSPQLNRSIMNFNTSIRQFWNFQSTKVLRILSRIRFTFWETMDASGIKWHELKFEKPHLNLPIFRNKFQICVRPIPPLSVSRRTWTRIFRGSAATAENLSGASSHAPRKSCSTEWGGQLQAATLARLTDFSIFTIRPMFRTWQIVA